MKRFQMNYLEYVMLFIICLLAMVLAFLANKQAQENKELLIEINRKIG